MSAEEVFVGEQISKIQLELQSDNVLALKRSLEDVKTSNQFSESKLILEQEIARLQNDLSHKQQEQIQNRVQLESLSHELTTYQSFFQTQNQLNLELQRLHNEQLQVYLN